MKIISRGSDSDYSDSAGDHGEPIFVMVQNDALKSSISSSNSMKKNIRDTINMKRQQAEQERASKMKAEELEADRQRIEKIEEEERKMAENKMRVANEEALRERKKRFANELTRKEASDKFKNKIRFMIEEKRDASSSESLDGGLKGFIQQIVLTNIKKKLESPDKTADSPA